MSPLPIRTHAQIRTEWCGTPTALSDGTAGVTLRLTEAMAVDDHGLVHGGFVFGVADHAAMLAVNHPHVVLGEAECRFVSPVRVGDEVVARAEVSSAAGKKRVLVVVATVADRVVFRGTLTAFILEDHVLQARPKQA